MRTTFLVYISGFLLFLTLLSHSHTAFPQGFRGGFSAGVAATQVDGDRLGGYDMTGFTGGIYVMNEIDETWAFSVGIRYFGKGSRKNADPDNGDYTYYRLRLHYTEIPVLAVYRWNKFRPEAGIGVGYLISSLEDSDAYGSVEPNPPFHRYDIPFIVGISYEFSKHLRFNTQYSYSILPIRPHPGNQTWYFDRGQYNNTINVTLQYTL